MFILVGVMLASVSCVCVWVGACMACACEWVHAWRVRVFVCARLNTRNNRINESEKTIPNPIFRISSETFFHRRLWSFQVDPVSSTCLSLRASQWRRQKSRRRQRRRRRRQRWWRWWRHAGGMTTTNACSHVRSITSWGRQKGSKREWAWKKREGIRVREHGKRGNVWENQGEWEKDHGEKEGELKRFRENES